MFVSGSRCSALLARQTGFASYSSPSTSTSSSSSSSTASASQFLTQSPRNYPPPSHPGICWPIAAEVKFLSPPGPRAPGPIAARGRSGRSAARARGFRTRGDPSTPPQELGGVRQRGTRPLVECGKDPTRSCQNPAPRPNTSRQIRFFLSVFFLASEEMWSAESGIG